MRVRVSYRVSARFIVRFCPSVSIMVWVKIRVIIRGRLQDSFWCRVRIRLVSFRFSVSVGRSYVL